jgi:hypothetical protein
LEKDADNWHSSVNANIYGINHAQFFPKDLVPGKMNDRAYLREYLEEKYYKTGRMAEFVSWLEKNVAAAQIQRDLEQLMGNKFGNETVEVFITVFGRGTYNVAENSFFLFYCHRDPEKSLTGIYHELMHFLFHRYYWEECQKAGLSEPQIQDLKESLTVLLNPILEKLGIAFLDQGYPKHQELRAKLKKLWDAGEYDENGFGLFLKKVLEQKLAAPDGIS